MPATETTEQEALFARASARHVRVTPQKARRIVDLVQATGSVGGGDAQSAYGEVQQVLRTIRVTR